MSARVDMKVVLERFINLKFAARMHAQNQDSQLRELELHDAALSYAAAVRKVARAKRDS